MLLLVTDTSGRQGSVALARANDGEPVGVIEAAPLTGGAFSAQLVPQIAGLLEKRGIGKTEIDAFVVVSGPGSFTGLRVGLAAIKALAEILQKPIVALSLLEIIARAAKRDGRITALLDAGRGDVYFAAYEIAGDSPKFLREELLARAEIANAAQDSVVVTPDAVLASAAREAGLTSVAVDPPDAKNIAELGLKKLNAGETVTPEQLEANYMRRSDAELFVKTSS